MKKYLDKEFLIPLGIILLLFIGLVATGCEAKVRISSEPSLIDGGTAEAQSSHYEFDLRDAGFGDLTILEVVSEDRDTSTIKIVAVDSDNQLITIMVVQSFVNMKPSVSISKLGVYAVQ